MQDSGLLLRRRESEASKNKKKETEESALECDRDQDGAVACELAGGRMVVVPTVSCCRKPRNACVDNIHEFSQQN